LAWPVSEFGPRAFVAQVDLEDVRAAKGPQWLPASGKLYAFAIPDGFGMPDFVRVMYSQSANTQRASMPAGTEWRFIARRIHFRPVMSAPNAEWIGVQHHRLINDLAPGEKATPRFDAPHDDEMQHRIGGFPNEIQDAQMALICERVSKGLPEPGYEPVLTP